MTARLFVYGTLRRGSDHRVARRLAHEATFLGDGRVRGRLISLGEYPGLAETSDSWVVGDVYALGQPDTLDWIDEYEGCGPSDPHPHEFERVQRGVVLQSGARDRAWVYVFTARQVVHRRHPEELTDDCANVARGRPR